MSSILFATRAALIVASLAYASYLDLKRREVDDWVWLFAGSVTLPLMFYEYAFLRVREAPLAALSIATMSILAYLFYRAGLYGGADAKALVVMAVATPLSYSVGLYELHPFLVFSAFTNALLLSLTVPIFMLSLNIYRLAIRREDIFEGFKQEPAHRKILALFMGTKIHDVEKHRYWGSMELVSHDGNKRFDFSISIEGLERSLNRSGWATPAIPLILFLEAGYLIEVLWGDLLAFIALALFG